MRWTTRSAPIVVFNVQIFFNKLDAIIHVADNFIISASEFDFLFKIFLISPLRSATKKGTRKGAFFVRYLIFIFYY